MKFTSILALASLSAVSASVNNDSYIVASTKALENLSCPISLEECDLKNCIRIRTDNNLTHGFNTEDLLQWCKEKKSHPTNRRGVHGFEIGRMELHEEYQKKARESDEMSLQLFSNDIMGKAIDIFSSFIQREMKLESLQELIIKRWLNFDAMDEIFQHLEMNPREKSEEIRKGFVKISNEIMEGKDLGVWFMRPSSYQDNRENLRSVRVLTSVVRGKGVEHRRIGYFDGYGYCYVSDQHISGDIFKIPPRNCYPSLFDLLSICNKSGVISFNKALLKKE